jgi:hypothetical protein
MNTATQEWIGGGCVWEIRDHAGNLLATVEHCDDRDELKKRLQTVGTISPSEGFVECRVTTTDEPRFLVRDGSGRNYCNEVRYTQFTAEDREYMEETYDVDGEQEENQTFGEWLDSSHAGDEFDNSDSMFTVIRIN